MRILLSNMKKNSKISPLQRRGKENKEKIYFQPIVPNQDICRTSNELIDLLVGRRWVQDRTQQDSRYEAKNTKNIYNIEKRVNG